MSAVDDRLDPAARLRAAGLRVTRPRLMVLETLADHPHVSADHVRSLLDEVEDHAVSRQAVYDVLHALTDAGLVRSMLVGTRALYELDLLDNHHHLLCRQCGALADVPCAVGHAPCLLPPDTQGFTVQTADVTYSGLCAACGTTQTT